MTVKRNWINVTTLGDLLDRQAAEVPDAEAVVFPDARYTFADIAARAQEIAKGLLALGVGPGDRVGYFLPEGIDTLAVLIGTTKIGAISAPLNARFKSHELRQVVVHCGMKVVVTAQPPGGTDFVALIDETFPEIANAKRDAFALDAAPELEHIVVLGDTTAPGMWNRTRFAERAATISDEAVLHRQQAVSVRDTAVIMYTSGTTSAPKGALLSHESFLRFADATCDPVTGRMPMTSDDRIWTALPSFHIGGVCFAIAALYAQATFVHVGHYHPDIALTQLRNEGCTIALAGFETIWLPIINHPERKPDDLASLRLMMCTGVPERLEQIQAATPHAPLMNCFGQTEACGFLSLSEIDDPHEVRMHSGGMPMPGMEVEVHDPDTDELLPLGSEGELWYRGPMRFDGYFRDPETTAAAFDHRGFFKSGDIVLLGTDGSVTFRSRVKDMLKVGGENVAAAEVEGYLITHPAINIAQVVSAPDARYVEVPAAFIELKPGADASEQEIIDFCRGKIATFRVPRYVRFVTEWPMSGTKIRKVELRARIAAELEGQGVTEAPRISST